jgi:predicted membrane-bound spermidine synthase
VLPFLIQATGKLNKFSIPVHIIFYILISGLATGIGYEFLLASKLRDKSFGQIAGENYSTDLLGSAFGAFLTAIFLLPVFGLNATCFVVAGLNIFSGILAYSKKKSGIFSF